MYNMFRERKPASRFAQGSPDAFANRPNVAPPTSFSVTIPLSTSTPAPATPTPVTPAQTTPVLVTTAVTEQSASSTSKPILHSSSSTASTSSTAPELSKQPIQGIDHMSCTKDSGVIRYEYSKGVASGFVKGLEQAAVTGDPNKILTSTVMGGIIGSLKGEMSAAQTCVPALPRNAPKP